ncbi:hypothetical protein Tco_0693640 [Tanacetum coccineum]
MDVHVHHEVPSGQTPTLLTIPVTVIIESPPVYTTTTPQSSPSFTPPPPLSTPTPPPTTKATNPPSALPDFASIFQFNNRVLALEKEVSELRKDDLLKTQVTALVDEHLDSRLRATKDDFMKSLEHAVLVKESSQPQSTYEAAAMLTEFELKKILIDKMEKSQSYVTDTPHKECYDGLIKSYELDNSLFSFYEKNQEGNLGNDDEEPMRKVAPKRDWFTKPRQPQEPTDPDWNIGKTPPQGPTQSWLMTLAATADKPSKTFDELMSTSIDFSAYIMNGLNITNLTQETLLGLAFKLLKGTRTNFAEFEYDFEECYKALSEKLDWDNP